MNVEIPVTYKMVNYIVEFNEPDSTPEPKAYNVRIESIKTNSEADPQMEELKGKEFNFKASELFQGNVNLPLDLIVKAYSDHITKDVNRINRV